MTSRTWTPGRPAAAVEDMFRKTPTEARKFANLRRRSRTTNPKDPMKTNQHENKPKVYHNRTELTYPEEHGGKYGNGSPEESANKRKKNDLDYAGGLRRSRRSSRS